MKFPGLKNKFRTAVLSGLAALGALTGCNLRPAAPPVPDTQILIDSSWSIKNIELDGVNTDWKSRQDFYLKDSSLKTKYQLWLSQLDKLKKLPLVEQAEKVNDLVNARVTWADDLSNYNSFEYYASGVETMLTGKGDCEDFAIAKFCALRHLGVPENRLAILGVATNPLDSIMRQPSHGVLALDTSAANNWTNALILNDNEELPSTVKTLGETGYTPIFMFNDKELRSCMVKVRKPPAPR
jgi:hypothetical protein